MKLTKDIIKTIRETIEANDYELDYTYIGIRIQEQPFELGALDHNSVVWDDGEETDEELNGACAINHTMLDAINCEYVGDHIAIIAGDSVEYGEDAGEIIIADAEVISVIC